jgi:hypothetical protein
VRKSWPSTGAPSGTLQLMRSRQIDSFQPPKREDLMVLPLRKQVELISVLYPRASVLTVSSSQASSVLQHHTLFGISRHSHSLSIESIAVRYPLSRWFPIHSFPCSSHSAPCFLLLLQWTTLTPLLISLLATNVRLFRILVSHCTCETEFSAHSSSILIPLSLQW